MSFIDRWGAIIFLITMVSSTLFAWTRTSELGSSFIFGVIAAGLAWLIYIVFKICTHDKVDTE